MQISNGNDSVSVFCHECNQFITQLPVKIIRELFEPGRGVYCGAQHLFGVGIDDQGRLVIRTEAGVSRVNSGEVSLKL